MPIVLLNLVNWGHLDRENDILERLGAKQKLFILRRQVSRTSQLATPVWWLTAPQDTVTKLGDVNQITHSNNLYDIQYKANIHIF